jgi:hypothetical protein
MAFSPMSGRYRPPSYPGQPLSASEFVRTAGGWLIRRYGSAIVGAGVRRMDRIVDDFSTRFGDGTPPSNPGTRTGSRSSNPRLMATARNSGDSSGPPPNVTGGRRRRRNPKVGNAGGSVDVDSTTKFTIDTGIDSGTLINPLQGPTKEFTPVLIQCGVLMPNLKDGSDDNFGQLVNSEIYFKYKILVQAEITNSFASFFTEENFYKILGTLSEALQLYYMIDSILAYTSVSPNVNIAMYKLRMAITPEIAAGHAKLGEFLRTCAIPPKMLEFIRYMYQNFTFSDTEGSTIIRLSYKDSLCTAEKDGLLNIDENTYEDIFVKLVNSSETISIMKKIKPSWVNDLPSSSYELMCDPQFSTFWHNSNISYESLQTKKVHYTITVNNQSDLLYYGIFDNRLDGLIYACASVTEVRGQDRIQQNGLWVPFDEFLNRNSITSSLLYYDSDGLIRSVQSYQHRYASMIHAAPYVERDQQGHMEYVATQVGYAGAAIPQLHSLVNTSQAVTRSVNWLLDP